MLTKTEIVLELIVNNHAGVMSHVTGLFSRRGFNIEGILCGKIGDGSRSRIYLLLESEEGLDQIIKQLEKLYDVIEVNHQKDVDSSIFGRLEDVMKG